MKGEYFEIKNYSERESNLFETYILRSMTCDVVISLFQRFVAGATGHEPVKQAYVNFADHRSKNIIIRRS